jgi:hypothetical protein
VGEDKKAITVHAQAIAKQSHGLDVLMNGKMSEAENGETILKEVLEDTFVRFCQFAYTSDYETPAFTLSGKLESAHGLSSRTTSRSSSLSRSNARSVALQAVELQPEPVPETELVVERLPDTVSEWNGWGLEPKKDKKLASKSVALRRKLDKKEYDIKTARSASMARCEIRENELSVEDYTPVFLGHARLYVFADEWGIEELKTLTLHKLHHTLITFTLFEARRTDIVELAKFAYSNENTPDLEDGVDALRALVIHYVTCELESLIESPEFLSLLEQEGQFSRDLVKMLMKRIE